jgi:hypothetical protein
VRPHLWHGGRAACLSPFALVKFEIVLMTSLTMVRCSFVLHAATPTRQRCQAGREQTTWHVMRPSAPTVGVTSTGCIAAAGARV